MTTRTADELRRTAAAKVTAFRDPAGTWHAYAGCAGPGRATHVMTVGALTRNPASAIAGCLAYRWARYRGDLGLPAQDTLALAA
jgi:hypothetical protein